jgi:hypothetical protein
MSASAHERSEVFWMKGSGTSTTSGGLPDIAPPVFREVQRFGQWIFWVPVAAVAAVVWWQFVEQVFLGHPQGAEPIPNWLAWVFAALFGVAFPGFAWAMRLITEVRPGELKVRLAPLRTVSIPLDQIIEAVVRQYSPLAEYGGWGARMSRRNGRAYNAFGSQGVQLVVVDSGRVLIGSQRPEELLAAIRLAGADLRRSDAEVEAGP